MNVFENAIYINHMLRPLQKQVLDKVFALINPNVTKSFDMAYLEQLKEVVITDIYVDKSFTHFLEKKHKENFEPMFCF